jgi:transcriptional regulator with XRE-family HTH domain
MTRTVMGVIDEPAKRASELFGQRLRETREARGLSQTELAEHMTNQGRPMSKAALLRIEKGTRGLSLDEAIALAAILYAAPVNLLSPPEDSLVELTSGRVVDGGGMRNFLLTGDSILAWPESPAEDDRERLRLILERSLTAYATALLDAIRGADPAGKRAALTAIQATVDDHRRALTQIERTKESDHA